MGKDKSEPETESLGYKDKAKAMYTLKCLDGRDITYQFRAISHYHRSAQKIIKITKDQDKVKNIREAIGVFDVWLNDYRENNRGKTNMSYLPIETLEAFLPLAKSYELLEKEFYNAYKAVGGDYKLMRTTKIDDGSTTWDIERNKRLNGILNDVKAKNINWYETEDDTLKGYPSKEHMRCILLGYSPEPSKLKLLLPKITEKFDSPREDEMDVVDMKNEKGKKISHDSSSDESSVDEEPPKKIPEKTQEPEKQDSGSSLGFKNKEKALKSIESLKGRDVSYQYHAISGLVKRAGRVISCTKDEEKINNMKEAVEIFDEWLSDYKKNNRGKNNLSYLPVETLEALIPLAKSYGVLNTEFYNAYKAVGGDYKVMRTTKIADGSTTWDIERNKRLNEILNDGKAKDIDWYETEEDTLKGYPSKEHVRCILLGYSPEPSKLKILIPKISKKFETPREEEMDVVDVKTERGKKRSHDDSSSDESSADEKSVKKMPKKSREEQDEGGSALGFKDKEKALKSIESLKERDVSYQYHAITGLAKRAERVISCTKDEEKIKNMKEAVEIFDKWVTDYNVNHRSSEHFGYLRMDIVQAYVPLAKKHGVEIPAFLKAYEHVGGNYKKLRSIKGPEGSTWDIERNKNLRPIVKDIKQRDIELFETDEPLRGLPTKEHTRCIMWGYSHDSSKLIKILPLLKEKLNLID